MKKESSSTFPILSQDLIWFFKDLSVGLHNNSHSRGPGDSLVRSISAVTRIFIYPKQLETIFSISFKIDNKIGQLDLFQLVLKSVTWLLDSSKYHFCNFYLKFQDFQALLTKFQDFQGLDFYFSNSMTFQDFQDQCEPCRAWDCRDDFLN